MKQKRILLLISVLLFCVTTVNSASGEAVYYERDGIRYYRWSTWDYVQTTEKENGYYSGEITVPPEITVGRKTYPVKGIHGFQNCANLTKINIPSSVEWIGEFYGCTSLPEIIIPSSVKNIYGNKAFQGCINLKHVVLGDGLKEIPASCFEDCSKLDKIDIPSNIVTIGGYAFAGCVSLGEVNFDKNSKLSKIDNNAFEKCVNLPSMVIPNAIKTIDDKAFFGCTNLESLTIGSGLEKMGASAFEGCKKLTSVTIIDGVAEIGNFAFRGCVSLPEIGVPNSVKSIGTGAFENCSGLVKAFIGKNVEEIGSRAFQECGNLLEIEIPNSVTDLGAEAFRGCSSLAHAKLGDGIKIIKESTFESCSSLQEIVIPDNVTKVDKYSFLGCSSLTAVGIGSGVQELGYGAFYNCSNLPKIKIPYNVVTIGTSCFAGCVNLRELSLFTKNVKNWFAGFESIIDIYIGKTVESLDESAFKECKKLERVSFDENSNLKVIEKYAFYKCYFLKKAILPESVTTIGEAAFQECKAIKLLSLPSTLNSIEKYAFWGCVSLDSISAYMPTPFVVNETVFSSETYNDAVLYVDKNEDKYRETFAWSKFFHIVKIGDEPSEGDGGKESDNYKKGGGGGGTSVSVRTYNYDITAKGKGDVVVDKKEESSGNDKGWTSAFDGLKLRDEQRMVEIAHYPDSGVPFKFIPDQGYVVKQVQFSSEKDGALKDVTSEIVYNESISGYTYKAFDKDTSAKLVVTFEAAANPNPGSEPLAVGTELNTQMNGVAATFVVNGNKTITLNRVADASRVEVPSTISYECVDYTVTEIAGTVTEQSNYAVFGSQVEEVVIPNTVTKIGTCTFFNCKKLTSVTIPSSVTSIGENAFYNCTALTSIQLPSTLKEIRDAAFVGCSGLTSFDIPSSLSTIGMGCFTGCSSLKAFTVGSKTDGRIGNYYMVVDGVLFGTWSSGDLSSLIAYPNRHGDTYVVPHGVTKILNYAFCLTEVKEVTLPVGLRRIYDYAFAYCSNLSKLTAKAILPCNAENAFIETASHATLHIPSEGLRELYQTESGWKEFGSISAGNGNVTAFADNARTMFYRVLDGSNVALMAISTEVKGVAEIPASVSHGGMTYNVTSIGTSEEKMVILGVDGITRHFNYSVLEMYGEHPSTLKGIVIPNTVTSIGNDAFSNAKLTSVDIPGNVTEIGDWAFYLNENLTSLTLGSGLTKIGEGAFAGCSLTKVDIPEGVTSIGSAAFNIGWMDMEVTIPSTVKFIGNGAFIASPDMGTELKIHITDLDAWSRIDSDGEYWEAPVVWYRLYQNGTEVKEVIIPDGMTSISKVFLSFIGLTKVTIPESVTDYGTAFYWCENLREVTNLSKTPQLIRIFTSGGINGTRVGSRSDNQEYVAFGKTNKNDCVLYVPAGTSALYQKAEGWKDFKNIVEMGSTGINGIVSDGQPFDIYNLQGRKVRSGATSFNGLPKGVYIVNGRKVTVTK